jgi:predicted transcriptional regulator
MGKSAILIDDEVKQALEREAALGNDSSSTIAEQAIDAFVRARGFKRAAIAEAVEEAKAGVFISGEAVDRWIASWDTDRELPVPEPDTFLPRR